MIGAKTVILGTGGAGSTDLNATLHGRRMAMALRIGLLPGDMEMMQFHRRRWRRRACSSRGLPRRAHLLNKDGERFPGRYAPNTMGSRRATSSHGPSRWRSTPGCDVDGNVLSISATSAPSASSSGCLGRAGSR
jgi:succinate dehydrogenase/fumarate reductase flavoprotein subunit